MDRFPMQARLDARRLFGLVAVVLSAASKASALTFALSLNNAHEVMTLDFVMGPEEAEGYSVESISGGGTLDGVQVLAASTPNSTYGDPYNAISYDPSSGVPPRSLDFYGRGGVSVDFNTLAATYVDTLNLGNNHFFFNNQDVNIVQESTCSGPLSNCVYDSGSQFAVAIGTPEPTTWALMLIGFGGLGLALRYRRGRRPSPEGCGSHAQNFGFG